MLSMYPLPGHPAASQPAVLRQPQLSGSCRSPSGGVYACWEPFPWQRPLWIRNVGRVGTDVKGLETTMEPEGSVDRGVDLLRKWCA